MPISQNTTIGKHIAKIEAEFGSGDIHMLSAYHDQSGRSMIILNQDVAKPSEQRDGPVMPIGTVTDDLERVDVLLTFDNTLSIDNLIAQLRVTRSYLVTQTAASEGGVSTPAGQGLPPDWHIKKPIADRVKVLLAQCIKEGRFPEWEEILWEIMQWPQPVASEGGAEG